MIHLVDKNKYPRVVDKLIKFTENGDITWKYSYMPYCDQSDEIYVKSSYSVYIQHLLFRLSEYTYRDKHPGFINKLLCRIPVIKTGYKLEILFCNQVIDMFPQMDSLKNLYVAVKSKSIDIDGVLDEIISEDI
jgi:hypothetical protein